MTGTPNSRVRVRSQPGAAVRIELYVTVDNQQVHRPGQGEGRVRTAGLWVVDVDRGASGVPHVAILDGMLPADALRSLLDEWDPIGVADSVDDEYECLFWPLVSRLRAGAGAAEIRDYLRHDMTDHFGLDADVDAISERLVA